MLLVVIIPGAVEPQCSNCLKYRPLVLMAYSGQAVVVLIVPVLERLHCIQHSPGHTNRGKVCMYTELALQDRALAVFTSHVVVSSDIHTRGYE